MKPRALAPGLLYYPINGTVTLDGKIVVRLVYAEPALIEHLLQAIVQHVRSPRSTPDSTRSSSDR